MKDTLSTYRTIAFETILAASACMCVGLIAYGTSVLTIYSHRFVFISDGLTGALTFYTLRRLRPRDTIGFLLVLFLFQGLILTKSFVYGSPFIDFIFFISVPFAAAIFFWSYRKNRHEVKHYDPLILGTFVATTILVARITREITMTLEGAVGAWPILPSSLVNEAIESFLIGAGLGVGLWVLDLPKVKTALHFSKGYVSRASAEKLA